jgi:hypothetical protein
MTAAAAPGADRATAVRPGTPKASLGGLLVRILGIYLWGRAQPESLPVPTLEGGAPGAAAPVSPQVRRLGTINRILAGLFTLAGLTAGVVALLASLHLHKSLGGFPVSGDSLLDSAERLRAGWRGGPLPSLYPSYKERLERVARLVEEGRESLLAADRERVACAEILNPMGLPGRILRGAAVVTPFEQALEKVAMPFHRSTAAYQEMQAQLQPYQRLGSKTPETVHATLAKAGAGHALALLLRDRSGRTVWPSAPPFMLAPGAMVELPLVQGAVVRLSDVVRAPGGANELAEDLDLPLERLPDAGITFPRNGAFVRLRYDPADSALAPALPPLPLAAEEELIPLPRELRGR